MPRSSWGYSRVTKDDRTYTNQSMWYSTTKYKRYVIISVDRGKKLIKFQHKSSYQSRYRENICQYNKRYLWQRHSQHNTQWWKAESLSAKIGSKTRMPPLTTSIQQYIRSLSHSHQTRKIYPKWKGWGEIVIICRWYSI